MSRPPVVVPLVDVLKDVFQGEVDLSSTVCLVQYPATWHTLGRVSLDFASPRRVILHINRRERRKRARTEAGEEASAVQDAPMDLEAELDRMMSADGYDDIENELCDPVPASDDDAEDEEEDVPCDADDAHVPDDVPLCDLRAPPELSEEQLIGARIAVERNLEIVRASTQSAAVANRDPVEARSISLVSTECTVDGVSELVYVAWDKEPGDRQGRRVKFELYRAVTLVHYRVPVEDFSRAEIIVSRCGVPIVRRPAGARPRLPDWCITVELLEATQLFSGPFIDIPIGISTEPENCVICVAGGAGEVAFPAAAARHYRCVNCLTIWHEHCATQCGVDVHGGFFCPVCTADAEA